MGVGCFIAGLRAGARLSRLERNGKSVSAGSAAGISRHPFRKPISFHAGAWADRRSGVCVAGSKIPAAKVGYVDEGWGGREERFEMRRGRIS
jgi:hypothetical protein